MRWASTLSLDSDLASGAEDALGRLRAELGGATPDLLIAFVSAPHAAAYDDVPALLGSAAGVVVGCSGGGVIGGGHEIEERAAVALVGASLPGVRVAAFHAETDRLPPVERRDDWRALLRTEGAEPSHVLLLAEPTTSDVEPLLAGLDRHLDGGRVVGGLASGAAEPGRNALFRGTAVHRSGAVGVTLTGDLTVDTIVAQGCRPIGEPMFVTSCQGHVLRALDGRPATRVLRDLYGRLDARDQELFRHSLFVGVVMRESRETYRQGDFLIRNIAGLDAATDAIAVGTSLHEGSVVQFHLRDAATSAEDLDTLLARARTNAGDTPPSGALLFSCLGRGVGLYGRPDHDSEVFRRHFGAVPLGGFFCNGEIGPVQDRTFIHGYTSSLALFAPRPR